MCVCGGGPSALDSETQPVSSYVPWANILISLVSFSFLKTKDLEWVIRKFLPTLDTY